MKYLKTSEVAKAAGLHPNTIRLYEEWGWLPSIPRTKSGYRQFTEYHIDQVRLVRFALQYTFLSGEIRKSGQTVIRLGAQGDVAGAYVQAKKHLALIQVERVQAEAAVEVLERWVQGSSATFSGECLQIKQALSVLDISYDKLRNWERNGLIQIPRHPKNGYRLFGKAEMNRLKVIRALRRARYSMMAILRMLIYLDQGQRDNLRQVLDTPSPEEDIIYATDRWLTKLEELEQQAVLMLDHLAKMLERYGDAAANLSEASELVSK